MAGLIPREEIDAVRSASRIEDIVGEYVMLRSAGVGSVKGLCPFHDEKTPSFHVRPAVGMFHCFGCGEKGDVFDFVIKMNHVTFTEAVEYLAGKCGITLHYEDGGRLTRSEEPGRRQRLLDAHRAAEAFYQQQLNSPEAHLGRDFLSKRGFTQAMCQHFGIGYSPQSWDALTRHLRGKGFTDRELQIAGLATQGSRGIYDRFRGRLMWPIRDITGATIGFGARRLDDTDKESPKYLNTPETPIYKKAQVLYGLDMAKKSIAKNRRVVIVEGYTDVMAAHVAGEDCAVATCGTAFGSEHVKIMRRLLGDTADPAAGVVSVTGKPRGGEVIFTFDGDEAGQKAAMRAFAEDQNFAAQTFVAVESSGMDPCDLRMARGDQALRALIESRTPLFEFVIRAVLEGENLRTPEGRVRALRAAAPVVARIKDRALRGEYARALAGWLGMSVDEVAREIRQASRYASRPTTQMQPSVTRSQNPDAPPRTESEDSVVRSLGNDLGDLRHMDPVTRNEAMAMASLLQYPTELIGAGFESLDGDSFTNPTLRAVHDVIRAIGGLDFFATVLREEESKRGVCSEAQLAATQRFLAEIRQAGGDMLDGTISQLAVMPLPQDDESRMRDFCRGQMAAVIRMDLMRRTANVRAQLQQLREEDPKYQEVFRELLILESRRKRFIEH